VVPPDSGELSLNMEIQGLGSGSPRASTPPLSSASYRSHHVHVSQVAFSIHHFGLEVLVHCEVFGLVRRKGREHKDTVRRRSQVSTTRTMPYAVVMVKKKGYKRSKSAGDEVGGREKIEDELELRRPLEMELDLVQVSDPFQST